MSMRKTIILAMSFVLLISAAGLSEAAEWNADTAHSVLTFKVRHLFSKTAGRFDDWAATIVFDPDHVEQGSVEVTVQTASVTTDNDDIPTVYATWPDRTCVAVDSATYSCNNKPERYTIVWVHPDYNHNQKTQP